MIQEWEGDLLNAMLLEQDENWEFTIVLDNVEDTDDW
jgi:hypothetical protein